MRSLKRYKLYGETVKHQGTVKKLVYHIKYKSNDLGSRKIILEKIGAI